MQQPGQIAGRDGASPTLESPAGMHKSFTERSLSVPLAPEERQRLDRTLRRLHEAMREFWSAWPPSLRSPSRLSGAIDVDQTTCQRLIALARQPYAGESMVDSLPGPRALRNVLRASARADEAPAAEIQTRLRSAVDELDELVLDFGGSLARLKRRLAATTAAARAPTIGSGERSSVDTGADVDADEMAREALFQAACHITGRHSRAVASIGLYDTVDVDQGELRHYRISANEGVVARADAIPMVLEAFDSEGKAANDKWQRAPALVPEFTSAEWTTVDLKPSPGFASRAMEITRRSEPSDVCIYTVFPVPDPRTLDDPIEESWYILYNPSAALVFDIYLHESIARQCLISLDVHLWQTSFANYPHGRWHTRLPHAPVIMQLGRGLSRSASALNRLQEPLTGEMFRRAGVDPDQYIGFRCEERFPLWRAGYRFALDFGRPG